MNLGQRALALAILEIGKGEDPKLGNNQGRDVARFRQEAGLPWSKGAWCSVFVCAKLVCAAKEAAEDLPFQPLASAENAFHNMLEVPGAELVLVPRAGDIILWKRRKLGVVIGRHIAFVRHFLRERNDLLVTVDGNKDRRWAGQKYALVDTFFHSQGDWRRDLAGIVRLP
jgi:hypothetical protein